MTEQPVLTVTDLCKSYTLRRDILGRPVERLDAVQGVSFTLHAGRTLALVGESGAGKSTVGRMVTRLIDPDSGSVRFRDRELTSLNGAELRRVRRHIQMIFQDPYSSLDPKIVVGAAVGEPLTIHEGLRGRERDERVVELLADVGLQEEHADRLPREMSGGQLQRVAIARALAAGPDVIVCDEPVSALDASIRAQVVNLLLDLQAARGLAYLFVSHDLEIVRHVAHEVAVMNRGRIVEQGPAEQVFDDPQEPYTKELLSAAPTATPRRPKARAARVGAGWLRMANALVQPGRPVAGQEARPW